MRIVVGLSGGVDSSVAAALLQEQGHEVIGMYMRNWHDETVTVDNACPWIDDANDAMLVASHLGIPYQVIDLSDAYKQRIVDVMFAEYAAGRTPNPDILCNREIKFDIFLEAALDLGAEAVATGHYCQKGEIQTEHGTVYRLLAGADANKDQSYFLCQLNQDQIRQALFPIGHLQKAEVRKIAKRLGLPTAEKKDSQGLCFVGKVKLPVFLQQQLQVKIGPIVEIPADHPQFAAAQSLRKTNPLRDAISHSWQPTDGDLVGEHPGAHFFTIGQRKGLHVGGKADPLFVIGRDMETNTLYVGQREDHPGLLKSCLRMKASDMHWLRPDCHETFKINHSAQFQARFRYRQPLRDVTLVQAEDGFVYMQFSSPQMGVAAGQYAAWYDENECIGSGIISD
ncbi:MAG: tRNA 2-thiouridine(34) synthase MnmA [Flavobacteriales bacterium]